MDLQRYAGKWYEIARFPNRFQRQCVANTTATYTLRADGKVTVENECDDAHGKRKRAKGVAKPADSSGTNNRLKVSFIWPFYGDYWIIGLDPEYRWAIVGTPKRDYLWILSRTPKMSETLYADLLARCRDQGFETERILRTRQDGD